MKSVLALAALLAIPAFAAPAPELSTAVDPDDGKIVGGVPAQAGDFPFIVSLSQGGSHFCGGSLLNAYTVVTAAHCSVGTAPGSVRVRAGSLRWASGGKQVGVSQIKVHPNYNGNTLNNDVALWHLSAPITQTANIKFAKLPVQGSDPFDGLATTVAGWGYTSETGSSLPAALRKVQVPVIGRAECERKYSPEEVTTAMWCAGLDQGGKDSCQGDSGGPIVNTATRVLIGLTSWGYGCARPNQPGVYTRVGQFVNWINNNKWSS